MKPWLVDHLTLDQQDFNLAIADQFKRRIYVTKKQLNIRLLIHWADHPGYRNEFDTDWLIMQTSINTKIMELKIMI